MEHPRLTIYPLWVYCQSMKKKTSRTPSCHESDHPDHSKDISRLNRINGQLGAVKRMIEEQRYCPEILIQLRAVYAAVRSLESSILEKHLHSCVTDAMTSKNRDQAEQKIQELIDLFNRS